MNINFRSVLITGALIASLVSTGALAETGYAVHYSDVFQGRKTANNEIFDQNKLTAAHKKIKFGTRVKVTNLENDRSVIVTINDRMATRNKNIIDVSKSAAKELDFIKAGRARVNLEIID
ncbi:MAG: septal ring lytic transglycosylase RlpA family protein [Burkholderiales bacterium]|nr:septal ring lytic transglycosylase RlpA family protein [Burkholderiales bacterium]MDR4517870.1 septal ring lytic transglycosylase RlpA family protein [Nitrosomonas sp.]